MRLKNETPFHITHLLHMYALDNSRGGNIRVRDLMRDCTIDEFPFGDGAIGITTNHSVAIAYQDKSTHIIRSVAPWDTIKINVKWDYPRDHGVIGNRIFTTNCASGMVTIADISEPNLPIRLCSRDTSKERNDCELNTADWRGQTWVSAGTGWLSQHPDSRELCTLVNLNTVKARIDWGIPIATGGRLYGHVTCDARNVVISALDPRESGVATEVYAGGVSYRFDPFRDVPNGVAMIPILDNNIEYHHIDIFDERSCAMIGTSMLLGSDEFLFCPRIINEIGDM